MLNFYGIHQDSTIKVKGIFWACLSVCWIGRRQEHARPILGLTSSTEKGSPLKLDSWSLLLFTNKCLYIRIHQQKVEKNPTSNIYFCLGFFKLGKTVTSILVTQKNKGLLSYSVGLGELLCVLPQPKETGHILVGQNSPVSHKMFVFIDFASGQVA